MQQLISKHVFSLVLSVTIIFTSIFLSSCSVKPPKNVEAIKNFELERYLGTWYEVARLDHSFERGMTDVTAQYSMREDGGVRVINKGYLVDKERWKEAEGKAYFVEDEKTGFLKVSFFGPFYGAYVIFRLDSVNYQYALVSGPNEEYLWLLARTPNLNKRTKEHLVDFAKSRGFDTSKLIYVTHTNQQSSVE